MFLSASTNVKFHTWPAEENEVPDLVYTPCTTSDITHVSWCNDGNYLALLSEIGNPEIVSTRDKNCARLVHIVQVVPDVSALAFQRTTKKYLALGTRNAQIALYDTKHRAITKLYSNLTSSVRNIDFSVEDHCMAAACNDGRIAIYGLIEGETCETLKLPNAARPTILRFHPKKPNHLAGSTENGDVVLWDIITTRKIFHVQSHACPISGLALTSDDAFLVSVGENHKLCIYDINAGECTFRSSLQEPLSAVDVMPAANYMAIGCNSGSVHLYDMRKLVQPVFSIKPHASRINKVLFSNQFVRSKPIINNINNTSKVSVDTLASAAEETDESQEKVNRNEANNIEDVVINQSEAIVYEKAKKVIMKTLRYHIGNLSNKMSDHFASLREVVENEISTLDAAIDEKCLSVANFLKKAKESESSNHEIEKESEL